MKQNEEKNGENMVMNIVLDTEFNTGDSQKNAGYFKSNLGLKRILRIFCF